MNAQPRLYLCLGLVWLVPLGLILAFRRHEIDRLEPAAPVAGLLLAAAAGIAMLVLWWRVRGVDAAAVASRPEKGSAADAEVTAAMDRWWAAAAQWLSSEERDRVIAAYATGLDELVEAGAITPTERRSAGEVHPWALWREARS